MKLQNKQQTSHFDENQAKKATESQITYYKGALQFTQFISGLVSS